MELRGTLIRRALRSCAPRRIVAALAAACMVVGLAASGCGGSGFKAAPVSGKVTVNGQPQSNVVVLFSPQGQGNEAGPGSSGRTDASGNFELKTVDGRPGAVVGKHIVRIQPAGEATDENSPKAGAPPAKLPPKAGDGSLTIDVPAAGTTSANFDL